LPKNRRGLWGYRFMGLWFVEEPKGFISLWVYGLLENRRGLWVYWFMGLCGGRVMGLLVYGVRRLLIYGVRTTLRTTAPTNSVIARPPNV
jgi:hypothetical protein